MALRTVIVFLLQIIWQHLQWYYRDCLHIPISRITLIAKTCIDTISLELGHHSCGLAMQSCPHVPSQDQVNPRWLRKLLKKKMQLTPNT